MLLLEIFHKIEKSGGQASLSVATVGGKTKMKLEIATTLAPPTESSSTSSPTGRCHRRRGPQARARRNQRAAAHQAALHLSLIAPSNVSFLVQGGGTFCGPQLFSFCT